MSHLIKIYAVCKFSIFRLWYLKKICLIATSAGGKKIKQYHRAILFYPITLGGRRGTTDEFATIPFQSCPVFSCPS